jgi:hypothetical protein
MFRSMWALVLNHRSLVSSTRRRLSTDQMQLREVGKLAMYPRKMLVAPEARAWGSAICLGVVGVDSLGLVGHIVPIAPGAGCLCLPWDPWQGVSSVALPGGWLSGPPLCL